MIRILHSVSNMDRAGIETMLMNYYRHIDRSKMRQVWERRQQMNASRSM